MRVIDNIFGNRELVEKIISDYGYSSDHNFWYFNNMKGDSVVPKFFVFDEKYAVFALHYLDDNDFEIISDVLAPPEERVSVLSQFVDHALSESGKVFLTLDKSLKRDFVRKIDSKYLAHKPTRVFDSPIYDLKKFDPSICGGQWKKVRNHLNQFFRNHKVEVRDFDSKDKEAVKFVVMGWGKSRKSSVAKSWIPVFLNFVENDFKGCDMARVIYVDDEPCSVTAGWRIPNSNGYYSAIGIHNYKYNGLGEAAYVDDLTQLKLRGFDFVDFGGSERKNLLDFKLKFAPERVVRQYLFGVSKR